MADVNITYKGASIATMDASGTKTLNTQGKYCEGDIIVQYTDPEKPTQTKSVTPTESAQTVTPDSGKVLSSVTVNAIPSNYIIPSGSLSISANGNYDVTEKASVAVSVPQIADIRVYEVELQNDITSKIKISDGDDWTLAHRADKNLVSAVSRDSEPDPPASDHYIVMAVCGNFTVGGDAYGSLIGKNPDGSNYRKLLYAALVSGPACALQVMKDGSVYLGASSSLMLAAGKYRAVLFLV